MCSAATISVYLHLETGTGPTHALRLLTAQVIAVTFFILFPLTFTFIRPEVGGVSGLLFESLGSFDKPFNQAPSLHIALLVILWDRYARHVPVRFGWLLHGWFTLIGLSVLTTYQHPFVDIPTGALLGFACLWAWPDDVPRPIEGRPVSTGRREALASGRVLRHGQPRILRAGPLAIGGAGLWLFWPAVSLLLVAANYAFIGAAGFQKSPDGRMSPAARWILAPYIAAAWINSRLWTRTEPLPGSGRGRRLGRAISLARHRVRLCHHHRSLRRITRTRQSGKRRSGMARFSDAGSGHTRR